MVKPLKICLNENLIVLSSGIGIHTPAWSTRICQFHFYWCIKKPFVGNLINSTDTKLRNYKYRCGTVKKTLSTQAEVFLSVLRYIYNRSVSVTCIFLSARFCPASLKQILLTYIRSLLPSFILKGGTKTDELSEEKILPHYISYMPCIPCKYTPKTLEWNRKLLLFKVISTLHHSYVKTYLSRWYSPEK